ncbi:hypothetical protein J4731_23065 [Providencia rettgeri]|nr:hypothetical protein [Providencia rettgeri]
MGFALVGAGSSNMVPVMFSAVGKQKTMPEALAVPNFNFRLFRYFGGTCSYWFCCFQLSLTALLLISALLVIIAFVTRFIRVILNLIRQPLQVQVKYSVLKIILMISLNTTR